jgi:hypothetical protein
VRINSDDHVEQLISDSEHSETQHIEFKSDSFSSMISNKNLRVQDTHGSIDEECSVVPDELVAVPHKSHYQIKLDVAHAINMVHQYKHTDYSSPRNRVDQMLNSIKETEEEASKSRCEDENNG